MKTKIERFIVVEELKAEKLAAVAQLSLAILALCLYLLSPKGFARPSEVWFEPVKILLSFYIPWLALRYVVTANRKSSPSLSYIFLALDVIVLTTLIFLFHIQYGRPVSLSLHAPTFLYFFFLICVRCLSYNFSKIVFVGLLSSFCWLLVLVYSVSQNNIIITRKFSEYVLPDRVLVGAELEKIFVLAVVTFVCALAVYRKKKLLTNFAEQSSRFLTMERLVGKAAFQSMAGHDREISPGQGSKRTAATMMIDLRGFSKLSYEISAEQVVSYLGQYQRIVAAEIFKNNGSVDKYMGDGVLAHFGAVATSQSFAKDAMLALEGIYRRLDIWRAEMFKEGRSFDFGIAVALGEVIFGVIGHEDRMEITVIGEAVNLSAKMEKHTKSSGYRALVTSKLMEMAISQGFASTEAAISLPNETISGIPHPIDLVGIGYNRTSTKDLV